MTRLSINKSRLKPADLSKDQWPHNQELAMRATNKIIGFKNFNPIEPVALVDSKPILLGTNEFVHHCRYDSTQNSQYHLRHG